MLYEGLFLPCLPKDYPIVSKTFLKASLVYIIAVFRLDLRQNRLLKKVEETLNSLSISAVKIG